MNVMIEVLLTLVGVVALIVSWRAWKKTARGAVRDRLFELRDEWRNHYVRFGLDMQDGAYGEIRDLINCMLRYTKRMRMIGFIYFTSNVNSEDVEKSTLRIESALGKCDVKTKELAQRIRRQASEAILLYMASTSLGFISAAAFMFIYILPDKILSALKTCLRSLFDVKPNTIEYAVLR